jgi:hypothetical protein
MADAPALAPALAPTLAAPAVTALSVATPAAPAGSGPADWAQRPTSPDFTAGQAQSLANRLIQNGADRQRVITALKAGGFEVQEVPDTRSADARAFDAAGLGPPLSPAEYRINYNAHGQSIDDVVKAAGEITQAFHAGGVPVRMAQGLFDALQASEQAVAGLTEPQRAMRTLEQRAMIGRMQSLGGAEQAILLASLPFGRMPEATRNALVAKGAFDSAESIVILAQIGRLMLAREKL